MIFDGPNHRIILEASDGNSISVAGMYSRWKDWVLTDGAQYEDAFLGSIGGEPLGGGVYVGGYVFLNTAAGWRIRPREEDHEIAFDGNLYPGVAGAAMFAPTLGSYQITRSLVKSPLTQAIATTGTSPSDLATAVWGHADAVALVNAVELVRKIVGNRLEVDIPGQRLRLYDDDGTTIIRSWPLATTGGELVTTATGVQTKRGVPT